ncbi:MAG: 5'-nucleotidase, lipoprotein e(P4) family [Bacteroidales bacterium]|nr:5'-nucleotidase, lipoprotein e(P4) family [Bacteroidales bacterium]
MKWTILTLLLVTFLFQSCNTSKEVVTARNSNNLLSSVSWFQNSAEMTALYYQGFNIAKLRLDEQLATNNSLKPLAVVVDIDETMLDNSPYETIVITKGEQKDGWYDWTTKASAKALPGALEFAHYAESKGVHIFYTTNHDYQEQAATLLNLQKEGFPFATNDHLLTRSDTAFYNGNTSSKVGRRAKVSSTHEIVLLIGDNLNDFSEVFEDRSVNYGKDAVEKNKALFGQRFIVLPNPMYGAWEKPLYDYKKNLTEDEKTELMLKKLR